MINNARDRPQSISLPVHSHSNGGRPLPHPLPGNDPESLRLKVENETLKDSVEVSEAKWRSLDEAQGQGKRIRELNSALHNSRMEFKRLNTIITKGYVPSTNPSDEQFRVEFCDIRGTILKIARDQYQATSMSLHSTRKETTTLVQRQQRWLSR